MTVPAMQQIADWLEKLGLAQYAQRFVENEIDVSVLRHLTDQDLKDIGVPLGHRRKMLTAIGELAGAAPAAPEPAPGTERKTQDSAERRQVTVMFSDLVGSTALSARMDPEDLREVISAYQKCVAETVRRFGGFVAKYMGDGVLVYFGYPQAHEDDAERAVRAGLELVAAVARLKTGAALQTRVGIATGLVVVGDLIGSGEAQERGIVGETPNLAARLQGIAEPNMLVIAEGTRRLLGNLFDLEDLGPKDLKGIAGPVRAWAALRASSAEGRFEALHASGLTALVGREEELELLLRRWSRAKTGEGQVVLLSGEAGIGKSRLTTALLERLASEPHTRLRYFCSSQHTDSAFYPIIGQMERAAGGCLAFLLFIPWPRAHRVGRADRPAGAGWAALRLFRLSDSPLWGERWYGRRGAGRALRGRGYRQTGGIERTALIARMRQVLDRKIPRSGGTTAWPSSRWSRAERPLSRGCAPWIGCASCI